MNKRKKRSNARITENKQIRQSLTTSKTKNGQDGKDKNGLVHQHRPQTKPKPKSQTFGRPVMSQPRVRKVDRRLSCSVYDQCRLGLFWFRPFGAVCVFFFFLVYFCFEFIFLGFVVAFFVYIFFVIVDKQIDKSLWLSFGSFFLMWFRLFPFFFLFFNNVLRYLTLLFLGCDIWFDCIIFELIDK